MPQKDQKIQYAGQPVVVQCSAAPDGYLPIPTLSEPAQGQQVLQVQEMQMDRIQMIVALLEQLRGAVQRDPGLLSSCSPNSLGLPQCQINPVETQVGTAAEKVLQAAQINLAHHLVLMVYQNTTSYPHISF